MTDLGRLRCETVLNAGGVQFWLIDSQGRPVAARGMRGVVSVVRDSLASSWKIVIRCCDL